MNAATPGRRSQAGRRGTALRIAARLAVPALLTLAIVVACARQATLLPAPVISAITPSSGSTAGGVAVTVTGESFFDRVSGSFPHELSVTVCGVELQDVRVAGTVRSIVLPGGARSSVVVGSTITGVTRASAADPAGDVAVRLPDGQTAVLADAFACLDPAPAIQVFTATPDEVTVGQEFEFSWEIVNPLDQDLECRIDTGAGEQLALEPCDLSGSRTHAYAQPGDYTATLHAGTVDGSQAEAELVIQVRQELPAAVDDEYETPEGTPLAVAAPGLLANDTVNDATAAGPALSAQGGAVSVAADGAFNYEPPAGFAGRDTFEYTLTNPSGTATATVGIEVLRPAHAQDDAGYVVQVGQVLNVAAADGVLVNDSGYPAPHVSAFDALSVGGGAVNVAEDGSFTYEPAPAFAGFDSFGYEVDNGVATSSATVHVEVRLEPAAADDDYATGMDTRLVVPAALGVLANDSGTPAPEVTDHDASSGAGGAVAVEADGGFTYDPPTGFTGHDSFGYEIANSAGSSAATVRIAVGDLPVGGADSYGTNVDVSLTEPAPGVLHNDTLNGGALTAGNFVTDAGGAVVLAADGGFTYDPPVNFRGDDTFTYELVNGLGAVQVPVTITVVPAGAPIALNDDFDAWYEETLDVPAPGVLANDTLDGATIVSFDATTIQGGSVALAADGSFSYQPPAGFAGTDTFTYELDNTVGTNSATVTIEVLRAALAVGDEYDVAIGAALTVPAPGLLGNDHGNPAPVVIGHDFHGSGGGAVAVQADGAFVYTPPTDFVGVDSFMYNISNGPGVISSAFVTVRVGTAPVAVDDAYASQRNSNLALDAPGVLANDDRQGATISVTGMEHGNVFWLEDNQDGSVVFVPEINFVGEASFEYTLSNEHGSSAATVLITMWLPVTANPDSYATPFGQVLNVDAADGVLANDTGWPDLEVDPFSDAGVVMLADGSFTFTPPSGFTGVHNFSYTARHAFSFHTALVSVTVGSPPVAQDDNLVTERDTGLTITLADLIGNDPVTDGIITIQSFDTAGLQGTIDGTVPGPGPWTYTPVAGFSGETSFGYTIENGLDSADATVNVLVWQAPVAADRSYSTDTDEPLSVNAVNGLLVGASGYPAPMAIAQNLPTNQEGGSVTIQADGSFVYTPPKGYSGQDSFPFQITNGYETVAVTATATIYVGLPPVANDDTFGPVLGNVPFHTNGTGTSSYLVSVFDNDLGGGLTIISPPAASAQGGQLVWYQRGDGSYDGTFSYFPPARFTGQDSFDYVIGIGPESTGTVTIDVENLIWFLDSATGAGGAGTLDDPAGTFADILPLTANSTVFMFARPTAYATPAAGLTLPNGLRLVGQSASGTGTLAGLAGVTVPPGSQALPVLTGDAGAPDLNNNLVTVAGGTVTLGTDNRLHGFRLQGTAAATSLLSGNGFGTLTAGTMELVASGRRGALELANGAVQAGFLSISATTATGQPVALSGVSGNLTIMGGALSGSAVDHQNQHCIDIAVAGVLVLDVTLTGMDLRHCHRGVVVNATGTAEIRFAASDMTVGHDSGTSPGSEVGTGFLLLARDSAELHAHVADSTITNPNANASGIGIDARAEGSGILVADFRGNVISGHDLGLQLAARSGGQSAAHMTVADNTVTSRSGGTDPAIGGIFMNTGHPATGDSLLCVHFPADGPNTISGPGTAMFDYVVEQYTGGALQLQGITAPANEAQVGAFLASRDGGSPTGIDVFLQSGSAAAGTCLTPLLPGTP